MQVIVMNNSAILSLRGALCVLVAMCVITASYADETQNGKEKKVPASALKKYDLNKDGVLDEAEKAEWEAAKASKSAAAMAKRLEAFDVNKDGNLDESELAAEKAAKKEAAEKKKAEKKTVSEVTAPMPEN
jgi:hypothetical protein